MLQRWFKKQSPNRVGIEFLADGVMVVLAAVQGKQTSKILNCDFLASSGQEEQSQALQQWVEKNHLQGHHCTVLLATEDYQIFPVDRPEVSAEELVAALSWKIKDLLGYPVDAAVIEAFDMPASDKNPANMMNVVASQLESVQAYVDVINASGLQLEMLDIPELSHTTLLNVVEQQEACTAVLSFYDGEGMLAIYKNLDMYVQRDVRVGLRHLQRREAGDNDLFDRLLLELQRSLDYFESYYGIGQVNQLMIMQDMTDSRDLGEYLRINLNLDVKYFPVAQFAVNDDICTNAAMVRAFSAALRVPQ